MSVHVISLRARLAGIQKNWKNQKFCRSNFFEFQKQHVCRLSVFVCFLPIPLIDVCACVCVCAYALCCRHAARGKAVLLSSVNVWCLASHCSASVFLLSSFFFLFAETLVQKFRVSIDQQLVLSTLYCSLNYERGNQFEFYFSHLG